MRWFSSAFDVASERLPEEISGIPVYWCQDIKDIKRKVLYPFISKIKDPDGFSDELLVQIYLSDLKRIRNEYPFDAVISTSEPYPMAVAASKLKGVEKVLYLMDPPALISSGHNTKYRTNTLVSTLQHQDVIVSTPFIFDALRQNGVDIGNVICRPVGFPMIHDLGFHSVYRQKNKIRLLFTGWMYSEIRSPEYFLKIVSGLDNRFIVTFMGKECEKLHERYNVRSKAQIVTIPQQPYKTALQAMADADILINIGNSVPVHMPSKTLEYINTGKPMVNFYKFAGCPTLYYTKRYPLALNMFEEESDIDSAAVCFVRFCEENVGKTVERNFIEREYADCTPQYIVQKILENLE